LYIGLLVEKVEDNLGVMDMKKALIYLMLIFCPLAAIADGWNSWARYKVASIIFEGPADGSWVIVRTNPQLAETGCTEPSYMYLDASSQKGQFIISSLLSAQARNSEFHIATNGCNGSRPVITGLWTLN
jgi:hypothetical protein